MSDDWMNESNDLDTVLQEEKRAEERAALEGEREARFSTGAPDEDYDDSWMSQTPDVDKELADAKLEVAIEMEAGAKTLYKMAKQVNKAAHQDEDPLKDIAKNVAVTKKHVGQTNVSLAAVVTNTGEKHHSQLCCACMCVVCLLVGAVISWQLGAFK